LNTFCEKIAEELNRICNIDGPVVITVSGIKAKRDLLLASAFRLAKKITEDTYGIGNVMRAVSICITPQKFHSRFISPTGYFEFPKNRTTRWASQNEIEF